MEIGDRVIVPRFTAWREEGVEYTVHDKKHRTGEVTNIRHPYVLVIMDHPIGLLEVIKCKIKEVSRL